MSWQHDQIRQCPSAMPVRQYQHLEWCTPVRVRVENVRSAGCCWHLWVTADDVTADDVTADDVTADDVTANDVAVNKDE